MRESETKGSAIVGAHLNLFILVAISLIFFTTGNRQSPIPIEWAIRVAQHLGIKSEACYRLYFTALVIADLRYFQKVRKGGEFICLHHNANILGGRY
jgi:hypothetical protein